MDPATEPYDDEDDWQPEPAGARVYPRAANAVWLAAAPVLLLSGICVAGMAVASTLPAVQFEQTLDPQNQLPPGSVPQVQAALPAIAALVGMLTVLPAATLLLLGFGIRRGSVRSLWHARWLNTSLLWMAGMGTVLLILSAVSSGVAGGFYLLIYGGVTALLFWSLRRVRAAQSAGETVVAAPDRYGSRDPWEPMHPRE